MDVVEGRTALVTGAAAGIGFGIAEALAKAGARVVLTDVDADGLERAAPAIGPNAATFALDVTDRRQWLAAAAFVEEAFGPLDILVNNAGIGPDLKPLADVSPESFDRLIAINLTGVFNGVHAFAAGMRARGRGHIINTGSMASLTAMPRLGPYTTAKFGVLGLSEVLRAEMAPFGVGVSVVCPGLVRTRLGQTASGATPPAATPSFIEPAVVGALVVEAIRANRLYVLTHGDYRDKVEERSTALLDAFEGVPRRG